MNSLVFHSAEGETVEVKNVFTPDLEALQPHNVRAVSVLIQSNEDHFIVKSVSYSARTTDGSDVVGVE